MYRDGYGRAVSIAYSFLISLLISSTLLLSCSVIREATAKSKDGRIDQGDFLNHSAMSTRYGLFSPMEASIIFHFAGRGSGAQRLALIDFAQLLDPRWKAPNEIDEPSKPVTTAATSFLAELGHSAYNFVQGGFAGALGATIVYPIDLGECPVIY